jgi:hypothetical protein
MGAVPNPATEKMPKSVGHGQLSVDETASQDQVKKHERLVSDRMQI